MDTVKRFVEKKKVKQRSWTITSTTIVNALYKLLYLFVVLATVKSSGKINESENKRFISHVNYRDLFQGEISVNHTYLYNKLHCEIVY
jgi:aspartokinase-like uncharacterized kinase